MLRHDLLRNAIKEAALQTGTGLPADWEGRLEGAVGREAVPWNRMRTDVCGRVRACLRDGTEEASFARLRPLVAAKLAKARFAGLPGRLSDILGQVPESSGRVTRADVMRLGAPGLRAATEIWRAGGAFDDAAFMAELLRNETGGSRTAAKFANGRAHDREALSAGLRKFLRTLGEGRPWTAADVQGWKCRADAGLGKRIYRAALSDGDTPERGMLALLGDGPEARAALARNPYRSRAAARWEAARASGILLAFLAKRPKGPWSPKDFVRGGKERLNCWTWLLKAGVRDGKSLAALSPDIAAALELRPFRRADRLDEGELADSARKFFKNLPKGSTWSPADLKRHDAALYAKMSRGGAGLPERLARLLGPAGARAMEGRAMERRVVPWSAERLRAAVHRFLEGLPEGASWTLGALAATGPEGRACADRLGRGGACLKRIENLLGAKTLARRPLKLPTRWSDAAIREALEAYVDALPAGAEWTWETFRQAGGERCARALMDGGHRLDRELAKKLLGEGHPALERCASRRRRWDGRSLRNFFLEQMRKMTTGRAWSVADLLADPENRSPYETARRSFPDLGWKERLAAILGPEADAALARNPFVPKDEARSGKVSAPLQKTG